MVDSKEDRLFSAHEAYAERLYTAIDQSCAAGDSWPVRGRAALHAALSLLAKDLAGAQLLTNTVGSAGAEGSKRYHGMIDSLAERLRSAAPGILPPIPNTEWGAVAFMSTMVGRSAMIGEGNRVLALEDEFAELLVALTHSTA